MNIREGCRQAGGNLERQSASSFEFGMVLRIKPGKLRPVRLDLVQSKGGIRRGGGG